MLSTNIKEIQTKVETLKIYIIIIYYNIFDRPDRLPGFPAWFYDPPRHSIRVDHLGFSLLIELIQSHLIMILVIKYIIIDRILNSISSPHDIGGGQVYRYAELS